MKNIVKIENNEAVVSVKDIALFSDYKIESVIKLLERNAERFGIVLPKGKGSYKDTVALQITERVATHLIVYMDNTENVMNFKDNLIRQFFTMRDILQEKHILTESKLIAENVKLKKDRAKYGSLASSDNKFKTLDWIRRNGEYANSVNWMYIQLCEAEHIHDELIEVHSYQPMSSISIKQGNQMLFHVDATMAFFESIKAERGDSFADKHPTLF